MSIKTTTLGAASLLAAAIFAGPALADGLPGRGKVADAPMPYGCTTAGNVGVTSDYVFRGISQTLEDPAVQGGVDFTCGRFYFGFWGSNVDFANGRDNVETDLYAGFKHTTGRINWDFGLIYYAYPGGSSDADYFEIKVAASGEIWKGGTLGGTVFFSPEYTFNSGEVVTLEGSFAQVLPRVGIFAPTFSALIGHSVGGADFQANFAIVDDNYTYWNVGLTLGFFDKWSLDLRYWDSNLDDDVVALDGSTVADERFVATLKYTF
jgi:uncharacterized protein (TIGR02001 family)